MEKYMGINQENWDERVQIHKNSNFYDVQGFKDGKLSLLPLELKELGEVKGKSLLHLQCHFGLDTLSWSRLGATVTGVDFSPKAIEYAKVLSQDLKLNADFILSNIYELEKHLDTYFDIVYSTYGVLCWLPDLYSWAKIIAHFLKPGAIFYLVDSHPFCHMYEEKTDLAFKPKFSYFHNVEPLECKVEYTYTDSDTKLKNQLTYEWTHSLSDIINSLINAGLYIEYLNEFSYTFYQCYPFLVQDEQGWWRIPESDEDFPLMFSLKAKKL